MAVGMGDERPSQPEYPRISFKRSFHQFRQLAIKAWREIDPDLPNLLLDHMKIIKKPICAGSDRAFRPDRLGSCTIRCTQGLIVVQKARV